MPLVSSGGFTLIASTPWLVGQQDADATIRKELHDGAQELTDMEIDQIRSRAPVDRGGLYASIWGITYLDPDDRNLSYIYPTDSEQLSAWNRVYAQYVEGGVLGSPTWTNPPREIFIQVTTTDLPLIEAWAFKFGDQALARLAAGTGVFI